jgi:hypothetical protein
MTDEEKVWIHVRFSMSHLKLNVYLVYNRIDHEEFYILHTENTMCSACISDQHLFPYAVLSDWFLGIFVELLKSTVKFFISVGSSVCLYGTARLSLDVFS